ncbi:putative RhoGAP group protein [Sordaria sp. MPI-SDFR-AT-0083]|nr:putative RhoGAP group protein [Sordaria sp. MPI-SDFR-AT-0083]
MSQLAHPADAGPSNQHYDGRAFTTAPPPPPPNSALPITPSSQRPESSFSPKSSNDRNNSITGLIQQPPSGSSSGQTSAMAGPSAVRADLVRNAPRNSSMDSAISAISTRSNNTTKASQETNAGPAEIAGLIKTAGSPEAVIQYLLKEKQSQAQQNAQLWRLVDKQRAMILGLNKDLERALKEKEKYRKKLKELLSDPDGPSVPAVAAAKAQEINRTSTGSDFSIQEHVLEVPGSPGQNPTNQRQSSVDMSMAPYPVTPPAGQPPSHGSPSAMGEMLDPSHMMPKPSEHALNHYDVDALEWEREKSRRQAAEAEEQATGLHIKPNLPPSRSLPSVPPQMPLPATPTEQSSSKRIDLPLRGQLPPPTSPPFRKPPPAPLQLKDSALHSKKAQQPVEADSGSEYDDDPKADQQSLEERRGRRRTREEDERDREIMARKEAELRSLSKKSKKSASKAPNEDAPPPPPAGMPSDPRFLEVKMSAPLQETTVSSLAGVLSGTVQRDASYAMPLLSPGLPSSPRPMPMGGVSSPPLSPRGMNFMGAPLSPRPPRAPIPLPPNTPLHISAPPTMPLPSPRPIHMVKETDSISSTSSPTKSTYESPTERTRIYRGFVTEEYPDLLLPPNALPSIDIRVASSRMKPSRASLLSMTQLEEDPVFTLAVFSRADGGELWRVEKDSASLAKLDNRLKCCPTFTARTPDRSLFSGHAPAKLDARRIALNQYLDELLNTPLDHGTALELCKYLSTHTLPPNADETGSSTGYENPEAVLTGPGGRPYRKGYLTKRGKNFGGWKARYFILDGPHLKYYETPGGAHLGTIKLQKAQIMTQVGKHGHHDDSPARGPGVENPDNQYRHAFVIKEPKKKDPTSVTTHVLCAESDRERDEWVSALLRWIDYTDDEKEDRSKKTQTHDRHDSTNSERANGNHNKKKQQVETVGRSYDTTKQGDLPQGVSSNQPPAQGHAVPSGFTISAPRDPQVISNSEAWGTKLGMGPSAPLPAPPVVEQKAPRPRRSIFGWGDSKEKAGKSIDAHHTLFGENGQANNHHGPVRPVFGAPLAEAVRYNAPVDVRVPLPAVVYRCIQYLDAKDAINEEGIFRLSGSNVVIKQLKERFNNEGDIDLVNDGQYHDIHAVASLLKAYLRELPTTILTRDLHPEFQSVTEKLPDQAQRIAALSVLVERLPQANGTLLRYLIAFLIKIINHADSNKMTVRNVAIVFSPTLNIPAPVFALFLQNYEAIFGIDPGEYELPTTDSGSVHSSTHERTGSHPSDTRSSTHSGSPYGQRPTMKPVIEGQVSRNTPTPPLSMSMQQMAQMNAAREHSRSTPTPPLQRPAYDDIALYSAQQGMRPSTGFGGSHDFHPSATPSYEQYSMKDRRKSSMPNLHPSGTRGQSRDDNRF